MTKIIAVANQKGGVAKSTTTVNVAAALAEKGRRVLLIDFDPQGALTIGLGINPLKLEKTVYHALIDPNTSLGDVLNSPKPGIDIAPATLDLAGAEIELLNEIGRERILSNKLQPILQHYDFVFVDCPPNLSLLTINALAGAQYVLIPTETQYLAYRALPLLFSTIEKIQQRSNPQLKILGIIPTKHRPGTVHNKEVLDLLRQNYDQYFIDIVFPVRTGLADSIVGGQSIIEFDNKSESAELFRKLAEVIENA
jgi:chromosome partitioning protein